MHISNHKWYSKVTKALEIAKSKKDMNIQKP